MSDARYKNGKIYKIVNNENDKVYYGSTCAPLYKRMHIHRSKHNKCMSKNVGVDLKQCQIILVEEIQCENKQQLLMRERWYIENNQCVNKMIPIRTEEEKTTYHIKHREKNKEKISEQGKKYYEENKEKIKEYRENNKEKIKEAQKKWTTENNQLLKKYYEENKKKIKEVQKIHYEKNKTELIKKSSDYYKNNKEKQLKYYKEYREKNHDKQLNAMKEWREKNNVKMTCDCGIICSKRNIKTHLKSKKHQNYLNTISS